MATWFQGPYEEFIKVSKEGYDKGVRILHFLGGTIDRPQGQAGDRADQDDDLAARARSTACSATWSAPAASTISWKSERPLGHRAAPADLREGPARSGRSRRRRSSSTATLLASFPEGYRHLAYLQTRIGYKVKPDMPGLDGPALAALYAKGAAWLKGKKLPRCAPAEALARPQQRAIFRANKKRLSGGTSDVVGRQIQPAQ